MTSTNSSAGQLCAAFLILCASAGTAVGQIYYVDKTNGSDLNSGTETMPFKTIRHAVGVVPPNGSAQLVIEAGVYGQSDENWPILLLNKHIAIAANKPQGPLNQEACVKLEGIGDLFDVRGSFMSMNIRDIEIDAGGYVVDCRQTSSVQPGTSGTFAFSNVDGVGRGLLDLRMVGIYGGPTSDADVFAEDCDFVTPPNPVSTIMRYEIGGHAKGLIELSRCRFESQSGTCLRVETVTASYTETVDVKVDTCIFADSPVGVNLISGILQSQLVSIAGKFDACVFYGCNKGFSALGDGIGNATLSTVVNRSIFRNNNLDAEISDASHFLGAANVRILSSFGEDPLIYAPGTGGSSADPLFVDEAGRDFHLRRGSPCIDYTFDFQPAPDFDSEPRDLDNNPDVGIDEFYDRAFYLHPAPPKLGGSAQVRSQGDGVATVPWVIGISSTGYAGFQLPGTLLLAAPALLANGVGDAAGAVDYTLSVPPNVNLMNRVITLQMGFFDFNILDLIYSPNAIDVKLCF